MASHWRSGKAVKRMQMLRSVPGVGGKCMAVECQLDPGGVGTELCAVGQVDAALKGWCQVWCLCLGGGGLELGAGGLLAQAVQGLPMGFL